MPGRVRLKPDTTYDLLSTCRWLTLRFSGSMTPFSLIEAISSDRSPITWRGWFGLGSTSSMATIRPTGVPADAANAST